jgi:hypothetical protein
MANYRTLLRHFPAAQDYLNQRKWIRRGDVLAYAPRAHTPSFSTDEFGFRHLRNEVLARPRSDGGSTRPGNPRRAGRPFSASLILKQLFFRAAGQWSAPGTKQTKSHAPHEVGF